MLFLLTGLALAAPYYDNSSVSLELPDGDLAPPLAAELERRVSAGAISNVYVRKGEGQLAPAVLTELGQPELLALSLSCEPAMRGAERDLLLPERDGSLVPVSVWWDGATAVVQRGVPRGGVTVEARGLRFGGRWTSAEQAAVIEALSLLSIPERQLLATTPLVRRRSQTGPNGEGACHEIVDGEPTIAFYDMAFEGDDSSFVGEATHPRPASVAVALHELGHGVVAWPALTAQRRFEQLNAAYRATWSEYEDHYERTSRAVDRYNRGRGVPLAEVQRLQRELAVHEARLAEAQSAVEDAAKEAEALQARSPVLEAYRRVPGAGSGPTRYGRTSLEESFAEAYALHLADPAALQRVMPEVAAWLAAGEHLRAAGIGEWPTR